MFNLKYYINKEKERQHFYYFDIYLSMFLFKNCTVSYLYDNLHK